ncbi:Periplasmic nitrate reductase component NapD [hydrothermal vent metagenome]|uniref:Periplasmic nitrate reductase component NapD n=1 Tax=hydrothermal vent metagenome TaxID=652676 RepID=A0A1W1B978_9ZZZZ
MNISSIVVQCKQEHYDQVKKALEESEICDYHFGDKSTGKLIITIEGKDVEEDMYRLSMIQAMPYILAADMMQTYQEDQLDEEIKKLEAADAVPNVLSDESIDFKDIVYNGDLKKKY